MNLNIYSNKKLSLTEKELLKRVEIKRINNINYGDKYVGKESNEFFNGYYKAMSGIIYETIPIEIDDQMTFDKYVNIYKERLNKSLMCFTLIKSFFESEKNKPTVDEIRGFNQFLNDNNAIFDNIFNGKKFIF